MYAPLLRRLVRSATALPRLAVLLAFLAPPAAWAGEELKIGMAEVDITPPPGFPMAGYYHERLAEGVIDPLKAKAIVFQQGQERGALVVADLTAVAVDLSAAVREQAAEKTGIPRANIVLAATHSHTAPDYSRDLYRYLAGAGPAPGRPAYAERLIASLVDVIAQANDAAAPAQVFSGHATQTTPISFCRRFVMRDGSVRTWMSLDNPEVVRPSAPIDPQVGLLLARSLEGDAALGLVSNFALHLDTVGGLAWSADYPYFVEQAVRETLGPKAISLFGTGCCGDINHVDPSRRERNTTDVIGKSLGATIRSGLEALAPLESPTLRVRTATVQAPLMEVSDEDVARSVEVLKKAQSGQPVDFYDHVIAHKTVLVDQFRPQPALDQPAEHISWGLTHSWRKVGPTLPIEITAFCLGQDVAIVCLPGEVFVDLGLAIKQGSPFRTTLVVELSNYVETAYIPTRAAYAGGGYEVTNSTVQPGTGEMFVEASLRILREAASAAAAP